MTTSILITLLALAFTGANAIKCKHNLDCPDNYFCYLSKTCSKCTDCSIYNRKHNSWKKCVNHPKECGSCLPGFEQEILTDGKIRDLCIQSEVTVPTANEKTLYDAVSFVPLYWIGLVIGITATLFGIAFFTKRVLLLPSGKIIKYNKFTEQRTQITSLPVYRSLRKDEVTSPTTSSHEEIHHDENKNQYMDRETPFHSWVTNEVQKSAKISNEVMQQSRRIQNEEYREILRDLPSQREEVISGRVFTNPDYETQDEQTTQDSILAVVPYDENRSERGYSSVEAMPQANTFSGQITQRQYETEHNTYHDQSNSSESSGDEGRIVLVIRQVINTHQECQNINVNN